ncbi:MAG: NifB/NifX family molybdenum-iron cluster-binding protein [Bacteroidales bacterium]
MSIVAIAAENKSLQSSLAYRAGQCPWFCLLKEDGSTEFVANPGKQAQAAFGVHAFNFLKSMNTRQVVARFFGPRFQELSRQEGISLVIPPRNISKVKEVIESMNKQNT